MRPGKEDNVIYKTSGLVTAEHIINLVLNNTELWNISGFVESYQNGREQGLLLHAGQDNCFYICEHRNSDYPTVYHGSYSLQSISEDAYQHQHSFKTCEDAANWIASVLLSQEAS